MRLIIPLASFVVMPALAVEPAGDLRLAPAKGGGFAIERDSGAPGVKATGIATISELIPLLTQQVNAQKVDYSNGVKFDGDYEIKVGREDGTLAQYESASDIIAFAAPETLIRAGGVTTLDGAIVFALKIDNKPAVQRFERGVITLTRTKKTL